MPSSLVSIHTVLLIDMAMPLSTVLAKLTKPRISSTVSALGELIGDTLFHALFLIAEGDRLRRVSQDGADLLYLIIMNISKFYLSRDQEFVTRAFSKSIDM